MNDEERNLLICIARVLLRHRVITDYRTIFDDLEDAIEAMEALSDE